jgi:hypothetical protein
MIQSEITKLINSSNANNYKRFNITKKLDVLGYIKYPKLYLEAVNLGSITKDGSNRVSEWRDSSLNYNHATQSIDTNKFIYVPISPINGLPSMFCDGIDDFMNLPDNFFPQGNGKYSIYMVCNSSDDSNKNILIFGSVPQTNRRVFIRHSSSQILTTGWYSNSLVSSGGVWIKNNNVIISSHYDQTGRTQYVNGVLAGSDSQTSKNTSSGNNRIGSSSYSGYIKTILVYDTDHLAETRNRINSFLAYTSGITLP